jgi:hypothetical protein
VVPEGHPAALPPSPVIIIIPPSVGIAALQVQPPPPAPKMRQVQVVLMPPVPEYVQAVPFITPPSALHPSPAMTPPPMPIG